MAEKTEQPTPRRLRKARAEGEVAVSQALGQAAALGAALILGPAALGALVETFSQAITGALQGRALDAAGLSLLVLSLSLPILAAAAVSAAALSLVQTGGLLAPRRLAPRFDRLDPIAGLGALLSAQRLFGLVRSLISATLVGFIAYVLIRGSMASLAHGVGNLSGVSVLTGQTVESLVGVAALVGLALALVDLGLVRRAFLQRFKMTKEEVRREHRESEGDPQVKAARRRAHREALLGSTLSNVKNASVVIINPTHLATALRYDEDQASAPEVVAQGQGDVARRIVEAARAYGVPVIQDVPVAQALRELEVGEEIPEALYEAVAEILRDVWEAERAEREPTPEPGT